MKKQRIMAMETGAVIFYFKKTLDKRFHMVYNKHENKAGTYVAHRLTQI